MGRLTRAELLELRRWNTPTIYNGWETVTGKNRLECHMSNGAICDYAPSMGAMVGYAVTVEYICTDEKIKEEHPDCYLDLYKYLAGIPGPKILMAKDLDAPNSKGSIFGEVTANAYRALGCVGAVTDGYVRDVDEGTYAGFKMMASRLGVGHAYSCPLYFGREIEIYGTTVKPGMLVHADKYGFIAIEEEDFPHLLEGVRFTDSNECRTTIPASRGAVGESTDEVVERMRKAMLEFNKNADEFRRKILEQ
ncbi:MAG: RraA family protein [Lachnospiraceae bacterium]|nr:RraA family protein [Lachnospiraceae bacterium]